MGLHNLVLAVILQDVISCVCVCVCVSWTASGEEAGMRHVVRADITSSACEMSIISSGIFSEIPSGDDKEVN